MVDYWGATADPNYGYSPYSGQLHYGQPELSSVPFTSKAGDGNSTTIEMIKTRIHNMHPEVLSALADQWLNAWTVLDNVRSYVLKESNLLHDKSWDSPKARDAFLRKGPGEALAYLDVWMEAAQKNVTALRHLVTIAQDARREIDALVAEYERKLKEAQNVDLGGRLSEWLDIGERYGTTSWDDAKKYQIQEQVQGVQKTYQQKAQELAYKIGNQHYDYTSMLSSGVGPPYRPMDAVLNSPGAPPMPSFPGGPGGAPPPPAAPPALPPAAPPAPAPPTNPNSLAPNGNPPVAPPVPAPPVKPAPTLPPTVPTSAVPPTPVLPPPPVALVPLPAPPPVLPKGGPGGLPSKAPTSLPPGAHQGAPTVPTGRQQPPNPGQLTKNSFGQRSGASQPPGMNQPPGKTLRRPPTPGGEGEHGGRGVQRPGAGEHGGRGAPPQQGRPGDRRRADRPDFAERTPGTPIDGEEAFGRPSGNLTPPVLKNPTGDRGRTRPGSTAELPPSMRPGGDGSELLRRDGTAPPVLNRPGRPGESLPPATRGRDDRRSAERDRDRKAPAGADWIGADDARAEAGSSVLDAPTLPPSGSRVSGLEEIPQGLRSRAATRPTGPARAARPGTVSPELSKRRTTDERRDQQQVDDEARGVVTDEQAFEVQTPGGGVVTSKRDEPVYEPEVRRVLGGDR
jgi:urease accessory protein UreE